MLAKVLWILRRASNPVHNTCLTTSTLLAIFQSLPIENPNDSDPIVDPPIQSVQFSLHIIFAQRRPFLKNTLHVLSTLSEPLIKRPQH